MPRITSFYTEQDGSGWVSMECKDKPEHYENKGYYHSSATHYGKEAALISMRYINFMDETGLIRSGNNFSIQGLKHKRGGSYGSHPDGFDHTTQWRRKGESFPLFILTEPYHLPNDEGIAKWDRCAKYYDVSYIIYPPSDQSLWYPNRTYMVWWWSPQHTDFDPKYLMRHKKADEVERRCKSGFTAVRKEE